MRLLGVLLLVILTAQSIWAQVEVVPLAFVVKPHNTAALLGTNATLDCTFSDLGPSGNQGIRWRTISEGNPAGNPIYISNRSDVESPYRALYGIDANSTIDQYNLIIKRASPEVSNLYVCETWPNGETEMANFITVEELQCPQEDQYVVAGEEFTASCSVAYHAYNPSNLPQMRPMLNWTWDDEAVMEHTSYNANNSHVETSTNATMIERHEPLKLTCNLTFSGDGAPSYTAGCNTHYYALYRANAIEISPSYDAEVPEIPVGTEITCNGNGRPAPTITWFDSAYNNQSSSESENGTILMVETSWVGKGAQTFICSASNTVQGESYTVEANFTFVTVNREEIKSGGVETWVIVVAVVVPVVVVALVAVIVFVVYYNKKKGGSNKNKSYDNNNRPSTGSSSAAPTAAASRSSEPVENQPFLYTPNPLPSQATFAQPLPRNPTISYEPGGRTQPPSASGYADIGVAPGSGIDRSLSRGGTPTQTYPYVGSVGSINGVGAGSVMGGRGTPAITIGPPYGAGGTATPGRMTPGNMSQNPPIADVTGSMMGSRGMPAITIGPPYGAGGTATPGRMTPGNVSQNAPSRQMSNVSSDSSRGSSYRAVVPQRPPQPGPTAYPMPRPAASLNSSLV